MPDARRGPVVAWRPLAAGLGRSLSSARAMIATALSAGSECCTRVIGAAAPLFHDRIEAMQRRILAVGAAARYAASDRLVVSALAAIAVAAAGWLFVSFDRPVRMTAHPSAAARAPDGVPIRG